MKHSNEAARLKTAVQNAPAGCMVYVAKQYATYFTSPPCDGRTYMVEDLRRHGILHVTYPDGTYERREVGVCRNNNLPGQWKKPHDKRAKRKWLMKKGSRLACDFGTGMAVPGATDTPPAFCLIDIHRVMRITGFKKSFIYEQVDFPEPVRLGTSRRSSVRWVEAEILAWVSALMSKRSRSTESM